MVSAYKTPPIIVVSLFLWETHRCNESAILLHSN